MEGLIKIMETALRDILNVKKAFENERGRVERIGQKQDEVAMFQANKEIDLDRREAEVKVIENIVSYREAADVLAKTTNEGRIKLENDKNAFDTYVKQEKSRLVTQGEEVNKQAEMYKRELKALQEAMEKVAKDAANLKGKVLGELAQNIT